MWASISKQKNWFPVLSTKFYLSIDWISAAISGPVEGTSSFTEQRLINESSSRHWLKRGY